MPENKIPDRIKMNKGESAAENLETLSLADLISFRNYAVEMSGIEDDIAEPQNSDPIFWLNFVSICDDQLHERAQNIVDSHQATRRTAKIQKDFKPRNV